MADVSASESLPLVSMSSGGELRPHSAIAGKSQRKMKMGAGPSRMDYYAVGFSSREQSPGRLQGLVKNLPCKAPFFLPCLENVQTVVDRTYKTF